jgi:hypothetical protein
MDEAEVREVIDTVPQLRGHSQVQQVVIAKQALAR